MIDARKQLSNSELLATLATRERQVFDFNFKKLKVNSNIELFKIAQECSLV